MSRTKWVVLKVHPKFKNRIKTEASRSDMSILKYTERIALSENREEVKKDKMRGNDFDFRF